MVRWVVPRWIVVGLLIRLALLPLHDPWDLQTWYNLFVDLAEGTSPYETAHELTVSHRAHRGLVGLREAPVRRRDLFYEYYAYPPLLIVLYTPLAKAAARVLPLRRQFMLHGPPALVVVPPAFHLFFKPPLFLAEVGTAFLLGRLAGADAARRFFLNPLVILVSAAWTVDAVMAFFLILAVYLLRREQYAASAAALAAGSLTKFFPAVLLPVVLLHLWHRNVSRRTILGYAATFGAVCIVVVAPFWTGFREALFFHAARPGANLSLHLPLFALGAGWGVDMTLLSHVVSPVLGVVTLTAALVLCYASLARRRVALTRALVITLLAFFLGSKVVNEPYIYVLIPLLALELARRSSAAGEALFRLLYALPLAFAGVNMPIVYLVGPLYRYLWADEIRVRHAWAQVAPLKEYTLVVAVLALAFVATLVFGLVALTREESDGQVPHTAP